MLQIDYKIIKRVGFKNPSARPSRDTFIEHISSLELSVKLKSELRKLHADFGSGLIGLCHNTNKEIFFWQALPVLPLTAPYIYLLALISADAQTSCGHIFHCTAK